VDKKLFIESIESKDELFAELLIPFNEQWLNNKKENNTGINTTIYKKGE
jgi:hypothetical protein